MTNKLLDFEAFEESDSAQCPQAIRPYVTELMLTGITVIPNSLPAALCDEIREGVVDLSLRNAEIFSRHRDGDGHYPRIINLHSAYPRLFDLFRCNELALAVQDYLFEGETALYTSLYYERGSAQDIHRDTPYFATKPEYRYFGTWVALEDTDADNGPLSVVRYGHRIPEFDRELIARRIFPDLAAIDPASGDLFLAYQTELNQAWRERGLVQETLCVRKGDTIIWHPQTPHGGAEIRDLARTRHSIVMHTTPITVPVYHQDVFFNPEKPVSDKAHWQYIEIGGRHYADFAEVGFGHSASYAADRFR